MRGVWAGTATGNVTGHILPLSLESTVHQIGVRGKDEGRGSV